MNCGAVRIFTVGNAEHKTRLKRNVEPGDTITLDELFSTIVKPLGMPSTIMN